MLVEPGIFERFGENHLFDFFSQTWNSSSSNHTPQRIHLPVKRQQKVMKCVNNWHLRPHSSGTDRKDNLSLYI